MQARDARTLEWLERIAAGDQAALREMYQAYAGRIYTFAFGSLRDPDEAHEVVVDTMYQVWRHADRFRGDSKASTWILGIARNVMLTKLRSRGPVHEELSDELPEDRPGPDEPVQRRQELEAILACAGALSEEQRECLHLVYFEEMELAEVAEIQGVPENTVKTRLFHARRKIKPCLADLLRREDK
jgi:RNA polymerase sigma-70 factor, ECF subfamily